MLPVLPRVGRKGERRCQRDITPACDELAGHQKLETTRRYTLPSAADRQRAVEDLQIDY